MDEKLQPASQTTDGYITHDDYTKFLNTANGSIPLVKPVADSTYQVLPDDAVLMFTASGGAAVTLPETALVGKTIRVVNGMGGTDAVTVSAADDITNSNTTGTQVIATGAANLFQWDGSLWNVIG